MAYQVKPVFVLLLLCWATAQSVATTATGGFASEGLSRHKLNQLERFVQHTIRCRQVPGVTLTVASEGETLLNKGYGKADIERDVDVTNETLFCVASLTKAFTATLLGLLFQNSSHTLDTPIAKILPAPCPLFPDELRSKYVTTRDLLLHKTGLPRYDMLWFTGAASKETILSRVPYMEQATDFRTVPVYNNIMYGMAGRVGEELSATGKTWEDLVQQYILAPLGMHHTTFLQWPRQRSRQYAAQYVNKDGGTLRLKPEIFRGAEAIAPAISLCSNGLDMARWARAQLAAAKAGRSPFEDQGHLGILQQVMSQTQQTMAVSSAWTSPIQRPGAPVTWSVDGYGLGWYTGYYRGFRIISHYGSFPGFYSMITIVPDLDLALFSSINGGRQNQPYTINSLLHSYIIDLSLGERPWLDTQPDQGCHFPAQSAAPQHSKPTHKVEHNTTNQVELLQYTGLYHHSLFGNCSIWLSEQTQQLGARYGMVELILTHKRQHTFEGRAAQETWLITNIQFTFTSEPSGDIVSFTLNLLQNAPVFTRWQNQHEGCRPHGEKAQTNAGHANGQTAPLLDLYWLITTLVCIGHSHG